MTLVTASMLKNTFSSKILTSPLANLKERFDGIVPWNDEQYYAERIRDFTADKQYDVFYQQEYASCYVHSINGTEPERSFSKAFSFDSY